MKLFQADIPIDLAGKNYRVDLYLSVYEACLDELTS